MRPESYNANKLLTLSRFLLIQVLLFSCSPVFSQNNAPPDSLSKLSEKFVPSRIDHIILSGNGSTVLSTSALIPPVSVGDHRTLIFLDSLKSKASKTLITRKLYDFMINVYEPTDHKVINDQSDINYVGHSNKRIRSVRIQKLDVFGTAIHSPDLNDPNKLEKFLNKTHINTNEIIIRKNLLFEAGDTISPLILSDNERLLRELPFIDDARIVIVPVSDAEADIVVLTKDVYSLGAKISSGSLNRGSVSLYEKNIIGMGHELGIEVPYDKDYSDSPGFGVHYTVNNIRKSFLNLNMYFSDGPGTKTYGLDLGRKFISSATKYAGGISLKEMFTSDDLDSMITPAEVKYNLQDYWLSRSFLLNEHAVSRIIIGIRYRNNNVFDHPDIDPDSYHYLQRHKLLLGSVAFSVQKFYKANLIYGYGRTEDIPHGGMANLTIGKEINEFKERTYLAINLSIGESLKSFGYFYSSAGFATFLNGPTTEQGMLALRTNYISNLLYFGRYRVRNFVNIDYTRGFDRYSDESLFYNCENGFSGFSNDSIIGTQRLSANIESVLFSPVNFYGFRFALFGFADIGFLFGTNEIVSNGEFLTSFGLGIRIRNDNLVFNTFQLRLGFFPNLPAYSNVSHVIISGEQLLKPYNFEPGPPSLLPYR